MASSSTITSSTALFRRLTWNSTVLVEIRLSDDIPIAATAGKYYIQAPRYTYLPLLIPEIRENFLEVFLDDQTLDELDEAQWWFEEDPGEEGVGRLASQGPCKWNWPIDLIELHSLISFPSSSSSSTQTQGQHSLKLILHLSNPPHDKIMVPPGIEPCKTQFVNQIKEADFVRWGNTKRVTNLRRADLEAGWEGVVQDDFDLHSRMASRILPLPLPLPASQVASPGLPSRPSSTEPSSFSASKNDSTYSARSMPIRLYLPDNAPVLQETISPTGPDAEIEGAGTPTTLFTYLSSLLPLLFPSPTEPYALAEPILNGVVVPPEAELAWLASCVCGADGWLRIGIRLKN